MTAPVPRYVTRLLLRPLSCAQLVRFVRCHSQPAFDHATTALNGAPIVGGGTRTEWEREGRARLNGAGDGEVEVQNVLGSSLASQSRPSPAGYSLLLEEGGGPAVCEAV